MIGGEGVSVTEVSLKDHSNDDDITSMLPLLFPEFRSGR